MSKKNVINIVIILAVIIFALAILNRPSPDTPVEIAKCIGENSVLYVQFGCPPCGIQEEMFGENYQYLNIIDCFYEREKCSEIEATPTWIIKNQKYRGVQSIEKLKELTGC